MREHDGHVYQLANAGEGAQELKFVRKENHEGALKMREDGTTNEVVLEALIDRMEHLQAKLPCGENAVVITKLEEALMWLNLMWLNRRTGKRDSRGVEGTPLP